MTQKHRVIVIEDDHDIRDMLVAMFEMLGYRAEGVVMPDDGLKRIQAAEDAGDPFTVASIDKLFELGGRQTTMFALGQELSKQIKEQFPYIATIMVTSKEHSAQEILDLRDNYHVDQFLHKAGLQPSDLQVAVEQATNRIGKRIASGQIPYQSAVVVSQYAEPDVIMCKPLFGMPRKANVFDCNVFMIMPFAEEFKHIYDDHIVEVMKEFGLTIKRGDEWFSQFDIMTEVWSAICGADFVIADCTGNNANVFYELAIAHTLGKTAIMITQSGSPIPFDIRARRVIRYDDTPDGRAELEDNLREAIRYLRQQSAG